MVAHSTLSLMYFLQWAPRMPPSLCFFLFTGLSFSASFTGFFLFCFLSLGCCMDLMGLQYPAYADGTCISFSTTVTLPIICSSYLHTFNLKTYTYPWLSNRSFPCNMSKTEPLISTPSLHTLSHGFYIQHHHFPGCLGSICVSHSWFFSFPNNPHPIQLHVLTALPSAYIMQISHRLLWFPAHQSPWDTHSPQSDISTEWFKKNRNQILLQSSRTSTNLTKNKLRTFPHILNAPFNLTPFYLCDLIYYHHRDTPVIVLLWTGQVSLRSFALTNTALPQIFNQLSATSSANKLVHFPL